ncbi:MAG: alpha-E domain-containing protein [Acidimicrobiales bacterium]
MLARHAENMFWAGRYVERAEDTARMLTATLQSAVSVSPQQASLNFDQLLRTLRQERPPGQLGPDDMLSLLVSDLTQPGSIVSSVGSSRENFGALRDQVPHELWEQTNRLHLRLQDRSFRLLLDRDPFAALDLVRDGCQQLAGIVATAMARDEGYRFLILGQVLERALMTCRLVNVRASELSGSYEEMALILRSLSALAAYHRTNRAASGPVEVVSFLVLGDSFPRSILFCLRRAEDQLAILDGETRSTPRLLLGRLRSELDYADVEHVVAHLRAKLDHIEVSLREVAAAIGSRYFRSGDELALHSQSLLPGIEAMQR